MKKIYLSAAVFLSTVLLMGGSSSAPSSAEIAKIPAKSCMDNRSYKDHTAGLMWQDEVYTDAEDAAYKQSRSLRKAGSLNHARRYCTALIYDGYADWRLPTSDELMAVHREEGSVFVNTRAVDFWTSTPASAGKYFVVYPADAYRFERKGSESNYIRCVRCMNN